MPKVEVECDACGGAVEKWPAEIERVDHVFCDSDCFAAFRSEKIAVECAWCGDEKQVKPSRAASYDRHFCDDDCRGAWLSEDQQGEGHNRYNRLKCECENCGETFTRKASAIRRGDRDGVYCSKECYYEGREYPAGADHPMWRGGYSPYYGANWHEQRRKVLERDDHRCQRCGATRDDLGQEPDVHHLIRREKFDDLEAANEVSNLVTLCRSCHRRWEGIPIRPSAD